MVWSSNLDRFLSSIGTINWPKIDINSNAQYELLANNLVCVRVKKISKNVENRVSSREKTKNAENAVWIKNKK